MDGQMEGGRTDGRRRRSKRWPDRGTTLVIGLYRSDIRLCFFPHKGLTLIPAMVVPGTSPNGGANGNGLLYVCPRVRLVSYVGTYSVHTSHAPWEA